MSRSSFAAFLNEVKSDEDFASDLKSALVSVNKDEISVIVAEFAHRKGIVVNLESLKAPANIAWDPEFSDEELEINGSCCGFRSNCGTSCIEFRSCLVPGYNFVD